jgi:transposase
MGVTNRVVGSASIEVNRRSRRAKTDRLDELKLVHMLVRVCYGEPRVWSELRVPSVADEAARQVSRERTALIQERTRPVNDRRRALGHRPTTCPDPRERQVKKRSCPGEEKTQGLDTAPNIEHARSG